MDVVWLKRDVRLHDHGPFAEVARSANPFLILYLYEPDQLAEPTVHGSHLSFLHEGLIDLDNRLQPGCTGKIDDEEKSTLTSLTICHSTAIDTLEFIHQNHHRIGRVLAHEETGHWQSFMRDKAVRKWCRSKGIPFIEFNQTGVTRCLRSRDDYSQKFKVLMTKPRHTTPKVNELRKRLTVLRNLPGSMPNSKLDLSSMSEIPKAQRSDRPQRQQKGGETKALATLESFLQERGSDFSAGISSPNTSWTSCSRLSPYLTFGHISLRYVLQTLQTRQDQLRKFKKEGRKIGSWLKSLQAFSSRLHWRSHFIQKLESEPYLENRDLCPAYQTLRREEGDWNPAYYQAWESGRTGFPFVDACMRCLLQHGWLNFRMRAMLVSFATYNLWLDWKRIAHHLARVFLDYEPGIHYPQLQMQAGTTGINAMRVYSVTKQGTDQDPKGIFIRRYVSELENVPDEHIHEPWKMAASVQSKVKTLISSCNESSKAMDNEDWNIYPEPIVNEQESAKRAKSRVAAVRKLESTRNLAHQVYEKHGSRNQRRDEMNNKKPKALSNKIEKEDPPKQLKISSIFARSRKRRRSDKEMTKNSIIPLESSVESQTVENRIRDKRTIVTQPKVLSPKKRPKVAAKVSSSCWSCKACTFLNDKPLGLACIICGTPRERIQQI